MEGMRYRYLSVVALVHVIWCGSGVFGDGAQTIFPDLKLEVKNKLSNCSLNDLTNGSECQCAKALHTECSEYRGETGVQCTSCAGSIDIDIGTNVSCETNPLDNFCKACSPDFDFRWIEQLPPLLPNQSQPRYDNATNSYPLDRALSVCRGEMNMTVELNPIGSGLELLRTVGCNKYVVYAYMLGVGYNVSYFRPIHGDSMSFILQCCRGGSASQCLSQQYQSFWKALKKSTHGCQRDLLVKDLATLGIELPDIDNAKPFGTLYAVDLRRLKMLVQLLGNVFQQLYGDTIRFLVGLSFAAAARHDCGHSWYIPGADRLYASVHHIQGDFYFPSTTPSPFDAQGTCGLSSTSEATRLNVCKSMGTVLYDNSDLSGMSILGCVVDCTSSRIDGVGGAFVSVVLLITEVDTKMMGFDDDNGGVGTIMQQLNTEGLNITNDVKAVVGVGFQFVAHMLQAEDLMTTIDWSSYTSEISNLTVQNIIPNMTEAMLAYETKRPYTPSHHSNRGSNTTIVIAAVVPSTLLIGVVVGLLARKTRAQNKHKLVTTAVDTSTTTTSAELTTCVTNYNDHNNTDHNTTTNNNNDYADSLDIINTDENNRTSQA